MVPSIEVNETHFMSDVADEDSVAGDADLLELPSASGNAPAPAPLPKGTSFEGKEAASSNFGNASDAHVSGY